MMQTRYPISNNLVFTKVMSDNKDLCIEVVERMIGLEVEDIEYVNVEHMLPSVHNRSVQLDVVLKATGKMVNLEMQTYNRDDIGRRMRVHRSLMDATQIGKGERFGSVDDNYVVFICTFDPFLEGRARYTFSTSCRESPDLVLDDGAISYVYNATGDLSALDEPTAKLLQYILTDNASASDGLVRDLEQAVKLACESEELQMGIHTLEQELADRYDYGVRVGREEEASRMSALFAAMVDAGVSSDDIVTALESVDKESLYEQYGIGD